MQLYLVHKYTLLTSDFNTGDDEERPIKLTIPVYPYVPSDELHVKKLMNAKHSLMSMQRSTSDGHLSVELSYKEVVENELTPKLGCIVRGGVILEQLQNLIYGGDPAKELKLEMTMAVNFMHHHHHSCGHEAHHFATHAIKITENLYKVTDMTENVPCYGTAQYGVSGIDFPVELNNNASAFFPDLMALSISVNVDDYVALDDTQQRAVDVNRRFLEDPSFSDFAIIAADGTKFPCHKMFLATQSDVLAAMLRSSFRETNLNQLQMCDSKKVVKALLDFLYCGDVREAVKDCNLACELYYTADRLNIDPLKRIIGDLLNGKDQDWYDVETALKLYAFLVYQEGEYVLDSKILSVLASKPTQELQDSPQWAEISKSPQRFKHMFVQAVKGFGDLKRNASTSFE